MINLIGKAGRSLVSILLDIEHLLRQTHAYDHANHSEVIVGLLDSDPEAAVRELTSNLFWGGSGSFSDLFLCSGNGDISDDFNRDNKLLAGLLLELLHALKAKGHNHPNFAFVEKSLANRSK